MSYHFEGFSSPRYTQVPDELFDELLPMLTGAELKVLLYIVRRTFGFKKDCDPISLNQFMTGIRTRAGEQLDHGCGIADRSTVTKALSHLEEMGIIQAERHQGEDGVHVTTVYALKFREPGSTVVGKSDYLGEGVVGKSDYPGSGEIRLGVVGKSDLQETSIRQETEPYQETGISKTSKERSELEKIVTEASKDLGDLEHVRSNRTRAANLAEQYSLDEHTMIKLCRATLETVKPRANSLERPMAYWFETLEDRCKSAPSARRSLAGRYWRMVQH